MNYQDPVLSSITFNWEHRDQQSVVHPCVRKYDSLKFVISNIERIKLIYIMPNPNIRFEGEVKHIELRNMARIGVEMMRAYSTYGSKDYRSN